MMVVMIRRRWLHVLLLLLSGDKDGLCADSPVPHSSNASITVHSLEELYIWSSCITTTLQSVSLSFSFPFLFLSFLFPSIVPLHRWSPGLPANCSQTLATVLSSSSRSQQYFFLSSSLPFYDRQLPLHCQLCECASNSNSNSLSQWLAATLPRFLLLFL